MSTEKDVTAFLKDFKEKLTLWGVLFREDRSKNVLALLELELRPKDRESILKELKPQDYVDGPRVDTLYGGADLWIFGKLVKEKEVYIKITLGAWGSSVICISFHCAEHKMKYPFK